MRERSGRAWVKVQKKMVKRKFQAMSKVPQRSGCPTQPGTRPLVDTVSPVDEIVVLLLPISSCVN